MGRKEVMVSDVTGTQAEPGEFSRLFVDEHPAYNDLPVQLDVLDDEVKSLLGDDVQLVLGRINSPDGTVTRFAVPVQVFEALRQDGMAAPMMEATARAARERRQSGKNRPVRRAQRARVNYATLEHAGEPHRGRITEAEKRIVREHLTEVNGRLRGKGMREIDPDDPMMAVRYGL